MSEGTKVTKRGIAARVSKDKKGVYLLPEGGDEAFWVNVGEFSPECPEELVKGSEIEVTYTKYGNRNLIDVIRVVDEPKPNRGANAQDVATVTQERVVEPIVIQQTPAGPDISTLRVFARVHALDLAARMLRYNLAYEIKDEELFRKAQVYESHILEAIGQEAEFSVRLSSEEVSEASTKDQSKSIAAKQGEFAGFLDQDRDFMQMLKGGGDCDAS